MKITAREWTALTQALQAAVAEYFEPSENRTILDFIATAKSSVDELVAQTQKGKK